MMTCGTSLELGTTEVQVSNEFAFEGRRVLLVKTPGFSDPFKNDTQARYPEADRHSLGNNVRATPHLPIPSTECLDRYENGSMLAGIIYMHRISDRRFTGVAGHNFDMLRKLCGESALENAILVANTWGEDSLSLGDTAALDPILQFFKPATDKGAQLTRHRNTTQSAHDTMRCVVNNRPIPLQIQRDLVEERKDLIDTSAGKVISDELDERIRHHATELRRIRDETRQASIPAPSYTTYPTKTTLQTDMMRWGLCWLVTQWPRDTKGAGLIHYTTT